MKFFYRCFYVKIQVFFAITLKNKIFAEFDPPYYTFLPNPSIYHRKDGVGFYISNNLIYTLQIDLNVMNEKIMEPLYIDINLKEKTITCGVVHRSPFQDAKSHCFFMKSLEQSLDKINIKDCFLFGDFNLLHPDK